jgi:flagellin-specific chaperone FliS
VEKIKYLLSMLDTGKRRQINMNMITIYFYIWYLLSMLDTDTWRERQVN